MQQTINIWYDITWIYIREKKIRVHIDNYFCGSISMILFQCIWDLVVAFGSLLSASSLFLGKHSVFSLLLLLNYFFFYWFTIILWCLLFTVIFIFIFAIFWGSFWIDQIFFFNPPFPLLFIFEVIYLLHFLVLYLTFNVCTCFIAFKKPELVIFFRLLLKTGNFYLVFNHGYILKI